MCYIYVCLVYDHAIKCNDTHLNPCGKGGAGAMRSAHIKVSVVIR